VSKLNKKDEAFLQVIEDKATALGFKCFDIYYSSRLSMTKQQIAAELGVSYPKFTAFCKEYYAFKKAQTGDFTREDFVRLFGVNYAE